MVRQHQTRNLEIPGSMLRIAPERRVAVIPQYTRAFGGMYWTSFVIV